MHVKFTVWTFKAFQKVSNIIAMVANCYVSAEDASHDAHMLPNTSIKMSFMNYTDCYAHLEKITIYILPIYFLISP